MRRIVVTGIGLITALGIGVERTWRGLIEGRSGVGPLRRFDPSSLRTQIGAEIHDFEPQTFIKNRRNLRMMTYNDQLALAGAVLAVRDAALALDQCDGERVGLFVGSNKEISNPMHLLEGSLVARRDDGSVDYRLLGERASSAFYPLFYVEGLQAASLFYISQELGIKGANTYFAGAAEVGVVAIGRAYRSILRGESDLALAGSFDDPASWWNMTKFDGLGVLTDRNDLGAAACRPYDTDHRGAVMGDGAAFVMLEERAAAEARGARIYAEIVGFGNGFDAYRLITPHPEGRGLTHAIGAALREAGSSPDEIDYVVAHGSATPLGDASETRGIRAALGSAADRVAASSVKPATGHLAAGAGALNAAVAALALYHHVAPPTLNLEHVAPGCELDWIPQQARPGPLHQVLALTRGLEGQNAALALRAA